MKTVFRRTLAALILASCLVILAIGIVIAQPMSPNVPGQGEHDHSLYDPACCNVDDCEPLEDEQVQVVPGGWVFPDGTFIPEGKERDSRDGRFHWCRGWAEACNAGYCRRTGQRTEIVEAGKPRMKCVYVPKGGS